MNLIDKAVYREDGVFRQSGVQIVRYADDFVLMGASIAQQVEARLEQLLERMGLQLNRTKTRKVDAREESFSFLGFTFRYDHDLHGRSGKYLNIYPAAKSEKKLRERIHEYLHHHGHLPAEKVAEGLNAILCGWLNYFIIDKVSYTNKCRRGLRWFLMNSLNQFYQRKSQRRSSLHGQQAYELLINRYGMIDVLSYKASAH
jgi:hypothetical protein